MDRPIGDIFEFKGVKLKVEESRTCNNCFLRNSNNCYNYNRTFGNCGGNGREDKKYVSFVKIEENMFTKDDLKTGMVVEYKNGERRLVIRDGIDILTSTNGWTSINNFLPDLCNKKGDDSLTIMRVYYGYIAEKSGTIDDTLKWGGDLLWERPKEKVELTLEQIADKFNIPVEQLRIKENK